MNTEGPDLMETAPAAPRPPHAWFRVLLGLGIFLVAVVTCAVIFGHYLDNRPTNFCDATAAAAASLQQVLVAAGIPATDIQRSAPRLRNEEDAAWYSYSFDIDTKAPFSDNIIKALIRRGVARAAATGLPHAEHEQRFSVTMDGREFAVLDIKQKTETTDLTPACAAVAADILSCLAVQGIPEETTRRTEPEQKQENALRWTCTRFEAMLPAGRSTEQLESALQTALAAHSARVSTRLGIRGTTTLVVALRGETCAEVVLNRGNDGLNDEPRFRLADLDAPELKIAQNVEFPDFEEMPLDSHDLDDLTLGLKLNFNSPVPPSEQQKKPRVAIIVDDGGFCGPIKEKILALDHNLTLAIMPEGPCAGEVARRGKEAGFQIMLHLPMQGTIVKPEGLTANMSAAQIRKMTEEGFAKVPGAVGVNNHMGSIFTQHEDAVKIFVNYVKERGNLFIIDSVTTAKTKLLATARKTGVPSGSRDVFLDMDKDSSMIPNRFNEMMRIAKKRGQAIAIGHFHEKTANVLAQMLPDLEKNGIELVHVSELVH